MQIDENVDILEKMAEDIKKNLDQFRALLKENKSSLTKNELVAILNGIVEHPVESTVKPAGIVDKIVKKGCLVQQSLVGFTIESFAREGQQLRERKSDSAGTNSGTTEGQG